MAHPCSDGVVTLVGRGPGSTNVIVIVGDETSHASGARRRASGHRASRDAQPAARRTAGRATTRRATDPIPASSRAAFSSRAATAIARRNWRSAAPRRSATTSARPFSIPQASFTLRTPNREITLLDRVISNSPLTISRSNVRGLYLREGPWQVHAGYSFFSTFEHLLLPTDKEAVAGLALPPPPHAAEQSHAEPLLLRRRASERPAWSAWHAALRDADGVRREVRRGARGQPIAWRRTGNRSSIGPTAARGRRCVSRPPSCHRSPRISRADGRSRADGCGRATSRASTPAVSSRRYTQGSVRSDEQRGQPRPAAPADASAGPSTVVPACRSSRTHRRLRRGSTA